MTHYKIQAAAIKNAVDESDRILLIAHKKPDADTLGSVCAWINLLAPKGKEIHAFCLDPVPDYLQHLPGSHHIQQDVAIFEQHFDAIILNDAASLDYAGIDQILGNKEKGKTLLINVDHHVTNPHYGDINLVIPDASSTAEVLTRLFVHWGEELRKPIAESLLHGLITDTDSLTNPATGYQALAIASQLVNAGADLHTVVQRTLHNKSIADLKLWGRAMSRLKHNKIYNSVATYVTQHDLDECGTTEQSVEGMVNYLTLIPNVDLIIFIRTQKDGALKGSLRTVKPNIDVAKLALLYGGGGHKKAAGFRLDGRLVISDDNWTIV